jgi:hypothetical protein
MYGTSVYFGSRTLETIPFCARKCVPSSTGYLFNGPPPAPTPKPAQGVNPRWPEDGPKLAQDGPKMAPKEPKMAQDGPKMAPRWLQYGPQNVLKMAQDGPKMGSKGPMMVLRRSKKYSSWLKHGLRKAHETTVEKSCPIFENQPHHSTIPPSQPKRNQTHTDHKEGRRQWRQPFNCMCISSGGGAIQYRGLISNSAHV